jgi:tetratricopeptide (TPR) repeat protein
MQYKTVKTEGFHIHVDKGEGGSNPVQDFTGQEDIQLLAKDIRHIKQGESHQQIAGDYFFGSNFYWIAIALLLGTFISLFIIFRQRAIANADVVGSRASKANKVATKRLKKAEKLMKEGKKSGEFFDEVLRALWGYVGDKLSMPVTQLSRDNIRERLSERGVDDEIIRPFMEALDECEFARYAPGDATGNMNKVYEAAMTAITQIATTMKKGGRAPLAVLVIMLLSVPMMAGAVTKADADSTYAQEHYQKAAQQYEQLLKQGVSADLYYNLGNCYYRMDNITLAVLNYERALLLSPGDKDIRFNLQMARSKTIDKIVPESEMFFVTWYRSLVNLMSVDAWARMALISLVAAIILALAYLFANLVWLRKVGFFGGLFFVIIFLLSNLFAWQQKKVLIHRSGAIIIQSAVNVKSTPSKNGTDLFILHEGTKVNITDGSMRGWKKIRVADGKEGWLETKEIEII